MIEHACRSRPLPSAFWRLLAVGAAGLMLLAGHAAAAPPVLTRAREVTNASPGHVRLRFEGRDLGQVRQVWTSAGLRYPVPESASPPGSARSPFELELPRGDAASPRLEGFRVVTLEGVSNPALVLFDSLPNRSDQDREDPPADSPPWVASDGVVRGQVAPLKTARFRFKARRQVPVSIETYAHRLGSSLDPQLVVRDPAGQIVALNDDDPALGADARLAFTPVLSGPYTVELRDSTYQGGDEFHYHLRIGRFPLVRSVFPPIVPAQVPSRVAWLGADPRSHGQVRVIAPAPDATGLAIVVRGPGETASGPVRLRVTSDPIVLRPAAQAAGAPVAVDSLPSVVAARFERPGDAHVYRFATLEDQEIECRAWTRSQGSACDVRLMLRDGTGRTLAESDPTAADDGRVMARVASAGSIDLVVEEINRQAGPSVVYSVDLRSLPAGVELSVETNRFAVPAKTPVPVSVKGRRRGYDGPVLFALESDPPGARVQEGHLGEKQTEGVVRVLPPRGLQPGEAFRFRLDGVLAVAGAVVRARVSTEPALRRDFPLLRSVPLDEGSWMWGCVVAPAPAP